MSDTEVKPIPKEEFIGEAYPDIKGRIKVCKIHNRDEWTKGRYEMVNGEIICLDCGWGTKVPGFIRVKDNKIVDLRIAASHND